MKILIIGILALGSVSAYAEYCSPVVSIGELEGAPIIAAELENGLKAIALNESRKMLIQTAYITGSKICYETKYDGFTVGELRLKR